MVFISLTTVKADLATPSIKIIVENASGDYYLDLLVNDEITYEVNQDYLKDELNRIGQKKLIEPTSVAKQVLKLIESKKDSGSIIVMEDSYE